MTTTKLNPSMELNSIPQAEDRDSIRAKAEAALDAKLQAMRELMNNQELNARATGILVNQVISGTDWSNANYSSADQCLQKKFKEIGSRRNLRRYATIATRFTDDHIRLFGTTMLDAV